MEGKKIAILAISLMALSAFILPASVSATQTDVLTATPSTVAWEGTVYISMAVHGAYWNGTAWCNVTDSNGHVNHLGGIALTGVTLINYKYANWSYMPDVPGAWNVTVQFQKTSGSGTFATHYTSFTQERTMISVARNINDLGPVILYIAIVLVLLILLMVVVTRVSGERGGKVK